MKKANITRRGLKKTMMAVLGIAGMTAFLAGCGDTETVESQQSISVSGSTSVTEVMELLAETWEQKNPSAVIEVQGTGSSAGIKAANDGTSEIGMSSRKVKPEEENANITEAILAHDGIAVVVNPDNKVNNLSKSTIADIFRGDVTNWKEVGGGNHPIVIVTRDPASGTRGAFEDIMKLTIKTPSGHNISAVADTAQVASGNGVVKTTVAHNPYAIGYVSLGTVDDSLKALEVDGVAPSVTTISNREYSIARPFVLLYDEETLSPEGRKYLKWILSDEGQNVVAKHGYIPVG
ncbi:Phosphate-binding protein PstS 1 [invertebrate metagenome]|uniref:Phosphate-binding protein PstS 1 n=1 Tax=invertebrate metagenome TaxID=1711999 RepID=A0A2H9TBV1_9ZZZZ